MTSANPDTLTPEEYLEIERKATVRSEYIAGRMFAMSGASRRHNLITGNVAGELRNQLKGRPCEVYSSDMRVKVSSTGLYTYPDVVAVCSEPRLEDDHFDTLLNPAVIVEVLSDSTEAYDRGEKFAQYRRLQSLREYVLVAQNKMRVERFARQTDQWVFSELNDPADSLRLPSLGCTLSLGDIYQRVDFMAANSPTTP